MTTPSAGPPDPVRELHAAVRRWIEANAEAQNENIRRNLPYVDLMFAFGFATLGDRARASALVEAARQVLVVPIPPDSRDHCTHLATVAAVVSNFLFKAFKYRVEQALAGQPHAGRLSGELRTELEEIKHKGRTTGTHNPYLVADYVIGRMRGYSRILEPQERIDVYSMWARNRDALQWALWEMGTACEPGELADRTRKLLNEGVPRQDAKEVRLLVLCEALPLSPRVGEAFAVELLEQVPAVLTEWSRPGVTEPPHSPRRQCEVLERALFVAGHYGRGDLVKRLVDSFVALARSKPPEMRFRLISDVAPQCLRSLKKLGMRDEIDRVLTMIHDGVLSGATVADLRRKYASRTETWAAVLQTQLNLAAGWLTFGRDELAAPVLEVAREELLSPAPVRLNPRDYTEVARAYVTALGEGSAEAGFARMTELFEKMDPRKITNTWTTAQYYSRFHLNLVEDVVFAACGMAPEQPHVRAGS